MSIAMPGATARTDVFADAFGMALGLDVLVGEKQRGGDRAVAITIPGFDNIRATDTVEGPVVSLHIAPVLAKGLRSAGFLG